MHHMGPSQHHHHMAHLEICRLGCKLCVVRKRGCIVRIVLGHYKSAEIISQGMQEFRHASALPGNIVVGAVWVGGVVVVVAKGV